MKRQNFFAISSALLSLLVSVEIHAQTTVTLNNGDDNVTAYDTTGNDTTFAIPGGSATQSGVVSGSGNLIKTGAGAVEFTASNSYTGSTDVREGTLSFTKPSFSFAEIPWFMTPMNGISVGDSATASLNVSGGVHLGNTGTLTLGNTGSGHGTLSLSNNLVPIIGSLSNTGDIVVGNAGTGIINLTSGGWLRVTGSMSLGSGTGGTGHVLADAGYLDLSEAFTIAEGANSIASLTITNNGSVITQGSLELGAGVGSSGQVSILNGGTLTLQDDASGDALRIGSGSGTVSIDGGTLKHVGTPSTAFTTSVPVTISGNSTFDTAGREMGVHGLVSGTGALEVIGSGMLTLTSDNTYTGGTTVSSGTLVLGGGGASGSIVGDITNNGWGVVFDRSDDYTFNGVISGSGRLYNEGHIVRLTKAQTYTGDTELRSGYFVLPTDVDQALSAMTSVSISSGATLDISNRKLTVAGLTGGGDVYSFGGSAGELTVNTAAGPLQNFYGSLGSTYADFSLVKSGDGTLVLSGANSYTGATTVSDGTLAVNGSISASSGVIVQNGGTLQGSGVIMSAVDIQDGGTLAPGNSIESLATGSLTLAAGATFSYEMDNDAASEVAGDLTAVTGDLLLDIGNASLLALMDFGASAWDAGDKLTLISYSGNWNGGLFEFDSAVLNDGDTIDFSGIEWIFDYDDTTAGTNYTSDLTGSSHVTMVAVPEPGAVLLVNLGLLALLRRNRCPMV